MTPLPDPRQLTQRPTIGRIVLYRSRTGNYTVPAMITAIQETLAPTGVELYEKTDGEQGVPPLSSPLHVHLAVFTPGIPGCRAEAQDFKIEGVRRAENVGGTYQEWDVPPAATTDGGGVVFLHANGFNGDDPEDPCAFAPGTWAFPAHV